MPNNLDQDAVRLAQAIRTKESGGNFSARGGSGEFGAYQFTEPTWRAGAQKYLGSADAPLTPENQNKVAYSQIKEWKDQGMRPDQIASMWNSGKPDATGNVGVNKFGVKYDTPAYVQGVGQEYQRLKGSQPQGGGGLINTAYAAESNATPQPKTSFLDKVGNVADTLFGGGKIGDAIGTQLARFSSGGRELARQEEAGIAPKGSVAETFKGPSTGQVIGDVGRVASNFLPVGRIAGGITSRLGAEGVKRGTRALGTIGASALTGGAIGAAEGMSEGKDLAGTLSSARTGAFIGGGLGAAGTGVTAGLRKIGNTSGQQKLEELTKGMSSLTNSFNKNSRGKSNPLATLQRENLMPEVIDGKMDAAKIRQTLQERLKTLTDQTRGVIESSGKVVPFNTFRREVMNTIQADKQLQALGKTEMVMKNANQILKSFRNSYGSRIPVSAIDDIRIAANTQWKDDVRDMYRAIGDASRKIVYDVVPDNTVRDALRKEGELIAAGDFARALHGKAVKGGRLGKGFATIAGTIAGTGAGSIMGPFGAIGGAAIGGTVANKIQGAMQKAYFKTPVADAARRVVNAIDNGAVSPGDRLLNTETGRRLEGSVKESLRRPGMGLSIQDVSKDVLRPGQRPVGADSFMRGDEWVPMEEVVARERFNIPALKKISFGGSDRDVYDLGDGNVLKVSKSARGLNQNISDYYAEDAGLIPKTIERGKNYIVKEKVDPPDANTKAMVAELKKLGGGYDLPDREGKVWDIFERHGYSSSDLMNYNPLWGDLSAIRNWGTKDGKPIMLDEGTLDGTLVRRSMDSVTGGTKNMLDPEFRQIYSMSRAAKKKFGDTDSKTMYGAGAGLSLLEAQRLRRKE